jgi:hypothetical protein
MSRHLASLTAAVLGTTAIGSPVVAQDPAPPLPALPAEPMPMGYASLYYQAGIPWAYGIGSWWYWNVGQPVGYGLCWRPAHDGGSYPCWWSGPAVVLGPSPPAAALAGAGGKPGCNCGAAAVAQTPARPEAVSTTADALTLYDRGFQAYWDGDHGRAVELLAAAADRGGDARVWYYLALSHTARGNREAATAAARYAAALDVTNPGVVGTALERVQGSTRVALNQARSEVGDRATAEAVLASRPNPMGRAMVVAVAGK